MPCNYKKYPSNWKTEIRPAILQRAGHRCERCGVGNYDIGYRDHEDKWRKIEASFAGDVEAEDAEAAGFKVIKIILTIAHLNNPDPMDCRPENLAALCQRCHNRHDAGMRQRNAAETRRKKRKMDSLF